MTEAEWLACTDPQDMLRHLRRRASDRKLRLFTVACCRRIWYLLPDERSIRAVEIGERYAEGKVSEGERRAVAEAAKDVDADGSNNAADAAYLAVEINSPPDHPDAAWGLASEALVSASYADPWHVEPRTTEHGVRYYPAAWVQEAYCHLLREIFGNPFRPVALKRSWRKPEVITLARSIYDERAFDRMPALADALEEAGCHDADILGHCRQPGEHVRGCWVVDRILGKS